MPRITVIVPVYQDQIGIDACLRAVSNQTYPLDLLEIVVVDNGSNPPVVLQNSFGTHAKLLVCWKKGAYAARNVGIAAATGDVLAFTDADCIPASTWITAGIAALRAGNWNRIVGGEVALSLSERPTAVERYQHLMGFGQAENVERLGFSVTANLFVTRAHIECVGPFNDELLSGGDAEWCWRAARLGILTIYEPRAVVHTPARASLVSAARQARRVAGGRRILRTQCLPHVPAERLVPRRPAMATAKWILTHPRLTPFERTRILAVAALLMVIRLFEVARLSVGMHPERR